MNLLRVGGVVCAAAILTGCHGETKHPMSIAFDDLTNETRSGTSRYTNFSTFVSVSGIVPANPLQSFSYQPGEMPPTHALGMSPKWTFRVKRYYDMDVKGEPARNAVATIRSRYVALRAKATELGGANAAVAIGKATLALPDAKTSEAQKQFDTALRALGVKEGKATRETVTAALDEKIKDVKKKEGEVASLQADLEKELQRWNVLLTRWSTSSTVSGGAEVENVAAAGYEEARSRSGVLILGNLLVESLHVGEDVFDLLRELNEGPRKLFAKTRITVFEVKAQQVAFVADEDFSRAISAYLDLDATEVAALSATVRNAAIRAQIALSAMAEFGGSGLLSSTDVKTETAPFYPPRLLQDDLEKLVLADKGYESVYVVRAQLKNMLARNLPEALCTHLQRVSENEQDPHAAAVAWLNGIDDRYKREDPVALFAGTRYAKGAPTIARTEQCVAAIAGKP